MGKGVVVLIVVFIKLNTRSWQNKDKGFFYFIFIMLHPHLSFIWTKYIFAFFFSFFAHTVVAKVARSWGNCYIRINLRFSTTRDVTYSRSSVRHMYWDAWYFGSVLVKQVWLQSVSSLVNIILYECQLHKLLHKVMAQISYKPSWHLHMYWPKYGHI